MSALYCALTATPAHQGECPVHGGADCLVRGWMQVVPPPRPGVLRRCWWWFKP